MERAAPWLLRLGALLILVSPLLPQAAAGPERYGALRIRKELASKAARMELLAVDVGLFLPAGIALVLLLGTRRGKRSLLRVPTLALLLVLSFALSTLGSLLLTASGGSARPVVPSFGLSLALFLVPLLLGGVAVSRGMEKGLGDAPDLLERLSCAVLLALQGLFLADAGWDLLVGMTGSSAQVRLLPGAAVEPLGAVLLAAGAVLASPRQRAAVDSAPASG